MATRNRPNCVRSRGSVTDSNERGAKVEFLPPQRFRKRAKLEVPSFVSADALLWASQRGLLRAAKSTIVPSFVLGTATCSREGKEERNERLCPLRQAESHSATTFVERTGVRNREFRRHTVSGCTRRGLGAHRSQATRDCGRSSFRSFSLGVAGGENESRVGPRRTLRLIRLRVRAWPQPRRAQPRLRRGSCTPAPRPAGSRPPNSHATLHAVASAMAPRHDAGLPYCV